MSLMEYIDMYDLISEEDDVKKLKHMAKYLLVGRALNDPNMSQQEAIALAEYATVDLGMAEEFTLH